MKVRFLRWHEFDSAVEHLATLVKSPVAVCGAPRGGLPLAVALSHKLCIPLSTAPYNAPQDMLWIDDIYESGRTWSENAQFGQRLVWINKSTSDIPCVEQEEPNVWLVAPWENKEKALEDYNLYNAKRRAYRAVNK